MTRQEIDTCIEKAKKVFPVWREVPVLEKINIMLKAAELLYHNRMELAELVLRDIGKDKNSAEMEVMQTAEMIRRTAQTARECEKQNAIQEDRRKYWKGRIYSVKREPLGVVLSITPYHYPVYLASANIVPALVTGNTVVLKPSSLGIRAGVYLIQMFQKAGIPKEVLQMIQADGKEQGDYIVTHPGIDFVHFTGSKATWSRIANQIIGKAVTLELGGMGNVLVLENADLDWAARQITSGAFSFSGQRCTSMKHVLVQKTVHDALLERIREQMKRLVIGNPYEVNADIVPIIQHQSAECAWQLIQDALEKGANLIEGGRREGDFIYPTLLDQVNKEMKLASEEPFAPIVSIEPVYSVDEAIATANRAECNLQAVVFSKDVNHATAIASQLQAGIVQINGKAEREPVHLPFRAGRSYHAGTQQICNTLESFTRPKTTIIQLTI